MKAAKQKLEKLGVATEPHRFEAKDAQQSSSSSQPSMHFIALTVVW
jgi:hypothetical protein